jgi:hypothetical protein
MKRAVSAIYIFLLVWSAVALIGAEIKPEWADIVVPPLWAVVVASPLVLMGAVGGLVEPREAIVWSSAIVFLSFMLALLVGVLRGPDVETRPDFLGLALAGICVCVATGGAIAWIRSRPSRQAGVFDAR